MSYELFEIFVTEMNHTCSDTCMVTVILDCATCEFLEYGVFLCLSFRTCTHSSEFVLVHFIFIIIIVIIITEL